MTVAWAHQASTSDAGFPTTTRTFTWKNTIGNTQAPADGELIYALALFSAAPSSVPIGFSPIQSGSVGSQFWFLYYKVAASEATTGTFTWGANQRSAITLISTSGALDSRVGTVGTQTSSPCTAPSYNVPVSGGLLVAFWAVRQTGSAGTNVYGFQSNPGGSWASIVDPSSSGGVTEVWTPSAWNLSNPALGLSGDQSRVTTGTPGGSNLITGHEEVGVQVFLSPSSLTPTVPGSSTPGVFPKLFIPRKDFRGQAR